jgi:hypothetical protein
MDFLKEGRLYHKSVNQETIQPAMSMYSSHLTASSLVRISSDTYAYIYTHTYTYTHTHTHTHTHDITGEKGNLNFFPLCTLQYYNL